MNIHPNDPAMPISIKVEVEYPNGDAGTDIKNYPGLSVRAELAARMQAALITKYGSQYDRDGDWHARTSVNAADALIKELNKE